MSKSVKKLTKKPATKAASQKVLTDQGEPVSEMEPLVGCESSGRRPQLNELVFELVSAATGFKASLPDGVVEALSDVVRSMNCYYSNLIEGHNIHPTQTGRVLQGQVSRMRENACPCGRAVASS